MLDDFFFIFFKQFTCFFFCEWLFIFVKCFIQQQDLKHSTCCPSTNQKVGSERSQAKHSSWTAEPTKPYSGGGCHCREEAAATHAPPLSPGANKSRRRAFILLRGYFPLKRHCIPTRIVPSEETLYSYANNSRSRDIIFLCK